MMTRSEKRQRMLNAEILHSEWLAIYSDLYRETHEETASDGEVIADALERLTVIDSPDRCDASTGGNDRRSP